MRPLAISYINITYREGGAAYIALVVFGGASTFGDSISHIMNPEPVSYDMPALVAMMAALLIKAWLGLYFRRRGKSLESDALSASGYEALLDVAITAATIASALITMAWGISTEAYLALAISLLILKMGVEILIKAVSKILGQRAKPELTQKAREVAGAVGGVEKACEIILVDYGPESVRGSMCIEVDERLSMGEADRIAKSVKMSVYLKCGVRLDAVGLYPITCTDDGEVSMRARLDELALRHDKVVGTHGFRLNREVGLVMLDVVVDFGDVDCDALSGLLEEEFSREFEGYRFLVTTATDTAD